MRKTENQEAVEKEQHKQESSEKEQRNREIQMKKGVIEYSSNTLSLESKREENLYKKAESIITCISILLVAIMSLIFELLDRLKNIDYLITIFGIILVALLLCSLLFAIMAHEAYKIEYTRTGKELIDFINSHLESYDSEIGFLDQRINDTDAMITSLEKANDKRKGNLKISRILLYIFLAMVGIFGITILVIAV